jgi:2'-5' RNA ligase
MRTFIAVILDPKIKEKLTRMVIQFKKISSGIKWVRPESMHITLKFLGNIDNQKADQIKEVMDHVSQKHRSFHLACIGVGTFPQKSRKPKVIWVGFNEHDPLKTLQSEIESELERIGFPKEKRNFHPHLTLGRIKKSAAFHNLIPELERAEQKEFGITKVDRITLFKSTLTPSGAIYDILHESELK